MRLTSSAVRWTLGIAALAWAVAVPSVGLAQAKPGAAEYKSRIRVRVTEPVPRHVALRVRSEVPANSLLRVRASGLAVLRTTRVDSVQVENDDPLEVVYRFSIADMDKDWSWHIKAMCMIVVRTRQPLSPGTLLRITLAESQKEPDTELGLTYSGVSWSIVGGRIGQETDRDMKPVTDPVFFDPVPGEPARVEACLKPDGRVTVSWLDACGNPTSPADNAVSLLSGDNATAAKKPPLQAPRDADRVEIRDAEGRTATSNARPLALDGTPIWFGEFHWHTEFSGDGQRDLTAAMASARDELSLDFAGPGDHMSPTGEYHHDFRPDGQARQCLAFEEPGRFAVIAGAELSYRYGHANVYADSFDLFCQMTGRFRETLLPQWKGRGYPHAALTSVCPAGRAMYIPHHVNTTSGSVVMDDGLPYWCAMDYPIPPNNDALRLIEVCQIRGAYESEALDPTWGVVAGGYGGSVQTALTRGYRVGFVAGSDNHCGWPTRNLDRTVSMTAVQSARLDQKSIFDALYRRRCYATSGVRIVADATLEGQPVGSEIRLASGEPRRFKIMIKGTAPLKAVQIVHHGIVLADLPVDGQSTDFVGEWSDERPGRPLKDAWYYVRARQADGHRVWLSPWFIDLAE